MKNNYKTQTLLKAIIQKIGIVLLLLPSNHIVQAQITQAVGAQSGRYGNPYQEAVFTAPTIQGVTTVCTSQTTQLSVDSGYNSYNWSNGSTTLSTTVSAGTYTITVTDAIGCTRSSSVNVIADPCTLPLNLTCFIEGFYIGSGIMNAALMNQGIGINPTITDSIELELHSKSSPYSLVTTVKTVLLNNGTSSATFMALPGEYYIAVKHRNGMYTWSSNPITFATANTNYNFSTAGTQAFGNNQIEVEPNVWALYSGDINQDATIDAFDYLLLDPDITAGSYGYLATDLTGDGVVDAFDYLILDPNLINGIGVVTP